MSNFKFELNSAGVRELLRSEAMVSVLSSYATGLAEKAEADVHIGPNRANVSVRTRTGKEDDHMNLLKAASESD